jgi:hypothetical protein
LEENTTNMKYKITIQHEFEDIDELARYFATALSEVEKIRKSPRFLVDEFKNLDEEEDVVWGTDWEMELIERNGLIQ